LWYINYGEVNQEDIVVAISNQTGMVSTRFLTSFSAHWITLRTALPIMCGGVAKFRGLSTTLDELALAKSERAGEQLRYSGTSDGEIKPGKIMRQRWKSCRAS